MPLVPGDEGGEGGQGADTQQKVVVNKGDMDFLLQQLRISEQHAAGAPLRSLIQDPLLHYGMRTVDGTFNNIIPGKEQFGAADRPFPRMAPPVLRPAGRATFDPDGPGPQNMGDSTSYAQTSGAVFDPQPRIISNLIVDQTSNNPAAAAAAAKTEGSQEDVDGKGTYFIPNIAPDVGESASFNSWFTFFGQFFDHGLDLINKGGSGTVFVPLQPDDPLYNPSSPNTNFMVITRATNRPGPDGRMGTADDVRDHINQTTPWVDQNQTYTSHPSHQVFLREYRLNASGRPVSTGHMLDGARGGIADWNEVKAQARTLLGINLTDEDVTNVPLLDTDPYGKFIPGPGGFPRMVVSSVLVEGSPTSPTNTTNAARTGHAFLDDIAHNASPVSSRGARLTPDADTEVNDINTPRPAGTYDDELLGIHRITGDGRGNENIGLTAVHTVFHAEHNRLVGHLKSVVLATANPVYISEWLVPGANQADGIQDNEWDGERLFQAARFGTEMQYQHLVFEEFARKVQPEVNVFSGYNTNLDPAIMAEFANSVYRFGHSMLTETIARTHPDGRRDDIGLIQAFLNPAEFNRSGTDDLNAAGNIVRGLTRQTGNEIDEFVTGALRSNLLGLPLDLATINIARGRDTGVPSLNQARRLFHAASSNPALVPYVSWNDYGLALRHPESLVNFVAAYGKHPTVTSASTLAAKRTAADALVSGTAPDGNDFMNGTGIWANQDDTGLNDVDFWMGGLAEKQMLFGGLLGSTFNYVFETQMEKLQDGDRLYYLHRLRGLNFFTQLEENSFAELIIRNVPAVKNLPFDVFSTPTYVFDLNNVGSAGPILDDPGTPEVNESSALLRMPDGTVRYNGEEHVVMGGTSGNDRIRADEGDDTIWGYEGDDRIEGDDGNDSINGGPGNDILTDLFGIENIKGGTGHDAINAGPGLGDLVFGGPGNDFLIAGTDPKESFGGQDNDFIHAGDSMDTVFGGEGDDWIEGGDQADLLQGDNGEPFQDSPIIGNDVIIGQGGNDDYDAESGDDILVSDTGTERHEGMLGFDWVTYKGSPEPANADLRLAVFQAPDVDDLRDRFDSVEGLSGWEGDDVLTGNDSVSAELTAVDTRSGQNNALNSREQIALINGLQALLGAGVSRFSEGNILLGGSGSDRITGRGGNDLIDGDRWLNVRIQVVGADGSEIGTADSMHGVLSNKSGILAGTPATLTLSQAMFAGTLHGGMLRIVRELRTGSGGTDTAVFRGPLDDYERTRSSDGSILVAHVRGNGGTGGRQDDGTDRLRNIERLEFADTTILASSVTESTNTTPPESVAGFSATPGDSIVLLQWTNPPRGVAVRMLRSTTGYAASPNATADQTNIFDGASDHFEDESAVNGTTYFYTVFARSSAGVYSSRATATARPFAGGGTPEDRDPPEPVAALQPTPGNAQASIAWTPPADAAGVRVLRSTTRFATGPSDTLEQVAVYDGAATNFTDTGLANGTTYYYSVFTRDAAGNWSTPATTTVTPVATAETPDAGTPPGGGPTPVDPPPAAGPGEPPVDVGDAQQGGCSATGSGSLAGAFGLLVLASLGRRRARLTGR